MDKLAEKILQSLAGKPDQNARDIAKDIGCERKVINHLLHSTLQKNVIQNVNYTWRLIANGKLQPDKMNGIRESTMPTKNKNTQKKENDNFSFEALKTIRNKLLDLTSRNRLLNFRHRKTGMVRVVDEMPDQLANEILSGHCVTFIPINEPTHDELIKHGYIRIDENDQEIQVKAYPSAKEWAKVKGIDTNLELPQTINTTDKKHNDKNIQSLLYPGELEAQLRSIRQKANTAIEETGANILYLAFGFLEWYEDSKSEIARYAPLYLIPVKIDRAKLDKKLGTYGYSIEFTGEEIISNLSLREKLKYDFHLELPKLEEDKDLPESYFEKLEKLLTKHQPRWNVRRYATLSMFDFGKLLMYLDLDPERWPLGTDNIQHHPIMQSFFAKSGTSDESNTALNFGEEYPIDELKDVHELYPLIDDADSSQHSALVDAIKGKNLVIEGPPGSGKSQTITNLIAAAIAQGKKVLFVAEKMAALQVVKSRLERAGLGDFCLELHSHKSQKKQVYENIAQRIARQNDYKYPNAFNLDIKMYEEKKEALSRYADLINSDWKSTGRTIHQIFATATRYREAFPYIRLEEIKPEHINGNSFDELASRRMTDELKKYADVYEEVRKQLGSKADLKAHPWFGVYNKSIQLFDCDEVSDLLSAYNNALCRLEVEINSLNQLLNSDELNHVDNFEQVITEIGQLPQLSGSENLNVLPKLTSAVTQQLAEYLDGYQTGKKLYSELQHKFESEILKQGEPYRNFKRSTNYLESKVIDHELSFSRIFQVQKQLYSIAQYSKQISEDILVLIEQVPALDSEVNCSINGIKALGEFLKHINSLNPALITRRADIFDNDELDAYLDELEKLIQQVQGLHVELESCSKLEQLPSVAELNEIKDILDNAGLFCWFSSDWRAAKAKLLGFANGLKPKLKEVKALLPKFISYQKLIEKIDNKKAFKQLLGAEFKGKDTPVTEIIALRNWYSNIRKTYSVGFGKQVPLAQALFSIDHDIFKGVQHFAKTKTLSVISAFLADCEKVSPIIKHDCFEYRDTEFLNNEAFPNFVDTFKQHLKNVQSACKHDESLASSNAMLGRLQEYISIEDLLSKTNLSKDLFGSNVELSLYKNSDNAFAEIQSTIVLSIKLKGLGSPCLRDYLTNCITTESYSELQSKLKKANKVFEGINTPFINFSKRVELDKTAWYSTDDGTLHSRIERNNKAIQNPKWLSSWIDFVRQRSRIVEDGLEKLLRKIETGQIDLEDIESIYLSAIYDLLSREIINEKPELAQFFGAEHNAIRKQFKIYDNKLKKLQRQKIAARVAKRGYGQTIAGVASGKVASYTEMGLIKKEITKKTRHVPIRQLIKRSGQSLSELKPCFMMGPHSVAQYLAPGELKFDLVVMDEASQIKPEDALGTIARGQQLVVVGDPKQLPPTSFFDKAVESDDEDATAIEQSESILDVSMPMFNARRLRWHYRSRHESLIAFSNQQFYDSNLVVFPSPASNSDEFGIKLTQVKHGRFVNQHNIEEAKVIAEAVRMHVINRSKESIGVVAMSANQREQIERCVEELAKEDKQFENALTKNAQADEPLFLKNLENVQGDERDVIFISCTYGSIEAGAATMPQRFGPINSGAGGRRLNVLFTRSKKRMHVFSSMTSKHIVAQSSSSPGVHALKRFLEFAETGQLQQLQHTGKQPDSDFEIAVMDALKLHGFNCIPQVGVAGYFIDLAVQDPGQPGRYLMGIECDGATYHSAKSARDRDRLRQSVLESLGWKISRIWSTDWFKNPQAQLQPILEELNSLKTEIPVVPEVESQLDDIQQIVEQEASAVIEVESLVSNQGTLEQKLLEFDKVISQQESKPILHAKRLLRPAMVAAICEFKPISKNEFLEIIPKYLRETTAKEHGKYLDQVLNIVAEDEKELAL